MRLILMLAALVFALQAPTTPEDKAKKPPPVEKDKAPPVEKDRNRGGPGATKEAQKLPQEIRQERTFALKVPADLHVAPGQRRDVTISLDSGIQFAQTVHIYFAAPEGMKVLPAHAQINAGDKQVTVTIVADRDVPMGDKILRMIGEPEAGESVLLKVPLHVDGPQ